MTSPLVLCPCCAFPTLSERRIYDICVICWWEDDGQDDGDANEVWGGRNGRYSLAQARANFLSHGHMYDAGHGIEVVEKPSARRLELLRYVAAVKNGAKLNQETLNDLIAGTRES